MRHHILPVIVLAILAAACGGAPDDGLSPDLRTARVATSSICSGQGAISAVALGDEEGTLSGMSDDPVATAAANNAVLGTLVDAIEAAALTDTLNNAQAVTVFAPTDCAFAALDAATLQSALQDPSGLLTSVIGLHIVPGQRLSAADLTGGTLGTFSGQQLTYTQDESGVILDGVARVIVPDIQTRNATVHLIDTVLLPGGTLAAGDAPGAAATGTTPTDSTTVCTDSELLGAVNGAPEQGTLQGMADDRVSVAASNNPVLTTLVETIIAANLVDTLNTTPELTVFAPTDCAFAALDPDRLAGALADPTGLLAQILGFHVIPNQRLNLADLNGDGELTTQVGIPLPYTVRDGVVTLNGQARILVGDIQTVNATVHLIDTVMLPTTG